MARNFVFLLPSYFFYPQMVRNFAGALVDVGAGRRSGDDVAALLATPQQSRLSSGSGARLAGGVGGLCDVASVLLGSDVGDALQLGSEDWRCLGAVGLGVRRCVGAVGRIAVTGVPVATYEIMRTKLVV